MKVKPRPLQRKLAVIESPPGIITNTPMQQMIFATEKELAMYKKSFPQLSIRWAEKEDRVKWKFSHQIFERNPEEQLW